MIFFCALANNSGGLLDNHDNKIFFKILTLECFTQNNIVSFYFSMGTTGMKQRTTMKENQRLLKEPCIGLLRPPLFRESPLLIGQGGGTQRPYGLSYF